MVLPSRAVAPNTARVVVAASVAAGGALIADARTKGAFLVSWAATNQDSPHLRNVNRPGTALAGAIYGTIVKETVV